MKKIYLLTFIAVIFSSVLYGQGKVVKGKVSAKDGSPMPGVSVLLLGTTVATATNGNGEFEIEVPADELGKKPKLVFSFIGLKTVTLDYDADLSNIVMEDDATQLSEVIVSGMAIEKDKARLGYAVQNVSGDELVQSRETNIVNALNSKVAGVQVVSSSGTPGASSTIRIRGTGSFSGNFQPLFVVDGIPIDNSENNASQERDANVPFTQGVSNSNRAIDLSSDDVETVTVLKGPAATALYGIRAANGAIVITSKRAKFGQTKPQFSFNAGYSFDMVNKLPELQNQYSQGLNGQYRGPETGTSASWGADINTLGYDGATDYPWDKKGNIVPITDPSFNGNKVTPYDNVNKFFKTGHTRNIGFSVTAGNDKANYLLSLNNNYTDGIVPLSDFGKTSVKLVSEYKATSKLSLKGSINYINSGGTRMQQGSNLSGIMLGLLRTPVSFDNGNGYSNAWSHADAYLFSDGSQRSYRAGGIYDNPYFTVNRNQTKDNVDRIITFAQAKYDLSSWLSATYRIGIDHYSDNRRGGFDVNAAAFPAGRTFENRSSNTDLTSDLIFSFNKKFGEFDITANAGHNMFDSQYGRTYSQGDALTVPNFQSLSNASSYLAYQSNTWLRRYGVYADVNIGYKNRYYLNITGRNDWTSTLVKKNNSFFYPSVGLSYLISEDLKDFGLLADDNILSFWKLRASWAQVGRDAPAYSTYSIYGQPLVNDGFTNGIPLPYGGQNGLQSGTSGGSTQPALGNPALKPENNTTYEVGTEIAFFKKRITFDFTYYHSENKNLIINTQIPSSSGYQYKYLNAGTIRNEGIEIVGSVIPVKTKDFQWSINVNFTRNRSKVIKIADGLDNVFLNGFTNSGSYAIYGQPFGVFYGTAYLKDNQGHIVVDADGYPITDSKSQVLGNPNPNWTSGIRNTFSYKGFSISALLDIRNGGSIWNGTRGALDFFGRAKETETRTAAAAPLENTVKQTGVDGDGNPVYAPNDIAIAKDQTFWRGYSSFQNGNDYSIETVNWIRMRELTLGYTFPKSIASKLKLGSIDFSVYARNLFLITDYKGIDPETNLTGTSSGMGLDYFNSPNTKSYGANLRVTF